MNDHDTLVAALRRMGLVDDAPRRMRHGEDASRRMTQGEDAPRRMKDVDDAHAPRVVLTPLAGGVSSDIYRADLPGGPVCVKRALAKLKVAAEWHAPTERNRFEAAWLRFAADVMPDAVPRVLGVDDAGLAFAMDWLDPQHYPVWKTALLSGDADAGIAADVGQRLACIHAASADRPDLARAFATDESFHALRLDPYLLECARRHAAVAPVLRALAERTASTRRVLVHGDVSPKNILVGPRGPVFVDAECAWFGDPAFDLAFCLNHLLLKCVHRPARALAFLAAYRALAQTYLTGVTWESAAALEARTAELLDGLLLARVDGKSPVEYLRTDVQRACVRGFALARLNAQAAGRGDAAHSGNAARSVEAARSADAARAAQVARSADACGPLDQLARAWQGHLLRSPLLEESA